MSKDAEMRGAGEDKTVEKMNSEAIVKVEESISLNTRITAC